MAYVRSRACRSGGTIRVRLVLPGLSLCSVLVVVLVVGVALWPGARLLQAQNPEKVPQVVPPLPPTAGPGFAPAQVVPTPEAKTPVPTTPAPVMPPPPRPSKTQVFRQLMHPLQKTVLAQEALRFKFNIDPKTPLKDLLPIPPQAEVRPFTPLIEDLARLPEVTFQQPLAKDLPAQKAQEQTALTIARINHINKTKSDHFLEALLETRSDLAGLPVAMGDSCRTTGERSKEFTRAVATVRQALSGTRTFTSVVAQPQPSGPPLAVMQQAITTDELSSFWERYNRDCLKEDKSDSQSGRSHHDLVTCARIAALMQVLAPESASMRLGLVKYLAGVSHVEATRALAKLALFTAEDDVRAAAVDALKVRRERDYTAILVQGLRYPLPAVARRASEAIVKLERADLVAQLVDFLEEPDPRTPVMKEINHKHVAVVRELVRINHHKNCLLCHAPGNTDRVSPETLTAAVPVPSEPLPTPSEGYQSSSPDILVRVDVTYLRQDFSMRLPVADANPWPEMQRFDFLVRTRVLTDKEKKAFEDTLAKRAPGVLSPYHRAILTALRELTGRDTEPTPQAWRRLLGLPARELRLETAQR